MLGSIYVPFTATSLKENLNASRPSEHPPVRGGNIKTLGGIVLDLKIQNLFIDLNGLPDGSNIGSTV